MSLAGEPSSRRWGSRLLLMVTSAALLAATAVLVSSEARIFTVRDAWQIPGVIAQAPVGFPLAATIAFARSIPEVVENDRLPPSVDDLLSHAPKAWPEPVRQTLGTRGMSWYRYYTVGSPTGTKNPMLAVDNAFPLMVKPSWLSAPPEAIKSWLADPEGVLVSASALRDLGARVGDRVTVSLGRTQLPLHIVGQYDGAMPDYLLAHWDHADAAIPAPARGQAEMLAIQPGEHAAAVRDLLYAAARTDGRPLMFDDGWEKVGAEIEAKRNPTRAVRLLMPALVTVLFSLVVLFSARLPTRASLGCVAVGAIVGALALLLWTRGHLELGVWAFHEVPITWIAIASATAVAAIAAASGRLPGFENASAGLFLLSLALAAIAFATIDGVDGSRKRLFANADIANDRFIAVVWPDDPSPTPPPSESEARELTNETLILVAMQSSQGISEKILLRGVGPESFSTRPEVRLPGGPAAVSFAKEGVWLSEAMLHHLQKPNERVVHVLGRDVPVLGIFESDGGDVESEIWCTPSMLRSLAPGSPRERRVSIARPLPSPTKASPTAWMRERELRLDRSDQFFTPRVMLYGRVLAAACAASVVLLLFAWLSLVRSGQLARRALACIAAVSVGLVAVGFLCHVPFYYAEHLIVLRVPVGRLILHCGAWALTILLASTLVSRWRGQRA